jgi:hypothetical protein
MAGRGGARPGGGRPLGSTVVRSRKVANDLAREGLTPLQVLIDAMRELWQMAAAAPTAAERIERKLQACAIAEKASPYLHPRLTSVAATVRQVTSVTDLSDNELAALMRSLSTGEVIDGKAEVLPLPSGKRELN